MRIRRPVFVLGPAVVGLLVAAAVPAAAGASAGSPAGASAGAGAAVRAASVAGPAGSSAGAGVAVRAAFVAGTVARLGVPGPAVGTAAEPAFGTAAVSGPGRGPLPTTVTEVRVGRHPGFDRVVFQTWGAAMPAWSVRYVPAVYRDPSGAPVPLLGAADLQVTLQGTNWIARPSVQPDLRPGLPALRQVAGAGEFEGVLTYGIGQATRAGFRAFTLTGPDRLVVDVRHP